MHNLMRYCSWRLDGYSLISNSFDFGSEIVNKVITACCWEMSTAVDVLFKTFIHLRNTN